MEFDNRRKFQRININGKVNLEFTKSRFDCCKLKNLSLTGMFVKGDFKRRKLKNCHVRMYHEDTSGHNCLQATGKVVWMSDDGLGLQFTSMTFENYMLLQTTLVNYAEEPVMILREFPKDSPFEISSM